jgi:hypothetical protein
MYYSNYVNVTERGFDTPRGGGGSGRFSRNWHVFTAVKNSQSWELCVESLYLVAPYLNISALAK